MQMHTLSSLQRAGLIAIVFGAVLAGCTKRHSTPAETPWLPESGEVVRAEVDAGGLPTRYAAYFDGKQVKRIGEVRQQNSREGEYVFSGARLVRYTGAALGSDATIELVFDMNGVLTNSSGGADEKEIAAIRTRAQLLRSLALARRTTLDHRS